MSTSYRLKDLADRFSCDYAGSQNSLVEGVASLTSANGGCMTFIDHARHLPAYESSGAALIITSPMLYKRMQRPCEALLTSQVRLVFAQIAALFEAVPVHQMGVSSSASIDSSAQLGDQISIADHVSIGPNVVIGDRCVVMPGVRIMGNVTLGDDCIIYPNVTLYHGVNIGHRVRIHAGTVIGSDGFGNVPDENGAWVRMPQLGGVRIADDVEIGANSAVDRGALDDTIIHEGVRIDNLVQIAHNVVIGRHTAIAGCSGIAGSTYIGAHCLIGGDCAINGHISIADHVILTGSTSVTSNITKPGIYSSTVSAQESRLWRRNAARLKHLDELIRKLIKKEI